MSETGQDGSPMDWAKFEHYFRELFSSSMSKHGDLAWMQKMLEPSLYNDLKDIQLAMVSQQPEVFETHRQVIVRVAVTDPTLLDHIRIRMCEHHLVLEGMEREEVRVLLPTAVKPRTARARYRDEVLQISARKRNIETYYHEVPVIY